MRQPRRDGPDNARNKPDGKSENQREHDATIAYGCGNFVDGEIRRRQTRAGSRSMLRLQAGAIPPRPPPELSAAPKPGILSWPPVPLIRPGMRVVTHFDCVIA